MVHIVLLSSSLLIGSVRTQDRILLTRAYLSALPALASKLLCATSPGRRSATKFARDSIKRSSTSCSTRNCPRAQARFRRLRPSSIHNLPFSFLFPAQGGNSFGIHAAVCIDEAASARGAADSVLAYCATAVVPARREMSKTRKILRIVGVAVVG